MKNSKVIPAKVNEGVLCDYSGNVILPNEKGIVVLKGRVFVYDKLISFLERNGQGFKKPILKPISKRNRSKKGFRKAKIKKGNVGHHRRKQVVFSKEGKAQEFKSIVEASEKLKIARCKIFSVLNGSRKTFQGYEIKYKD